MINFIVDHQEATRRVVRGDRKAPDPRPQARKLRLHMEKATGFTL